MTVGKGEVHVERNQDGGGASFKVKQTKKAY